MVRLIHKYSLVDVACGVCLCRKLIEIITDSMELAHEAEIVGMGAFFWDIAVDEGAQIALFCKPCFFYIGLELLVFLLIQPHLDADASLSQYLNSLLLVFIEIKEAATGSDGSKGS